LVYPDLPKGANYVKNIANSAIERIVRIKCLEDGVGPVFIVRIDYYYHVKIESNIELPAKKLLFSDAIRNGIMIQRQESLVVN
jgi:hypothetical protein